MKFDVKAFVASVKVAVFSKTYCPYCTRVKGLFQKLGVKADVIELDTRDDGDQIQSALAAWTGQKTVPSVFIGGKHIGGCDDTFKLEGSGQLVPMLKSAGAL
eukprot:jgi/Mesvir1/10098/Mv06971-RA.1